MLKIVIENLHHREIKSNDKVRKVIDLIHENHIDWMHACGKKGRCTTCKIIVKKGMDNLTALTEKEEFFRKNNRLNPSERLSCQAYLESGEIRVCVAEENKFTHMDYSD